MKIIFLVRRKKSRSTTGESGRKYIDQVIKLAKDAIKDLVNISLAFIVDRLFGEGPVQSFIIRNPPDTKVNGKDIGPTTVPLS